MSEVTPVARKKREEVEQYYLSEWIAKRFPNASRVMFQVPITGVPYEYAKGRTDVSPQWFWRFGYRADAIVVNDSTLYVIEAESRRPVTGLAELIVYLAGVDKSPNLGPYRHLDRKGILVTTIMDEEVYRQCLKNNIEYVIYRPDWILPHLKRWGVID
jgi:hypothetical protein